MAEQSPGRGKPRRQLPEGPSAETVMQHPEGVGCAAAGVNYASDPQGKVHVPPHVVADLQAHGFVVVD